MFHKKLKIEKNQKKMWAALKYWLLYSYKAKNRKPTLQKNVGCKWAALKTATRANLAPKSPQPTFLYSLRTRRVN